MQKLTKNFQIRMILNEIRERDEDILRNLREAINERDAPRWRRLTYEAKRLGKFARDSLSTCTLSVCRTCTTTQNWGKLDLNFVNLILLT